ncbi:MAG: DUF1629 domain-containing protein [Allomuricauda sp.]
MDKKFYIITNNLFDDSEFAYGMQNKVNHKTGEAKICQGCGVYISMLEWLPPFEVNVSKKKLADFIYGPFVGFIISKKFKRKFELTNLKGVVSFKKVDLYYKKKLLEEEYYYADIEIVNAFIDLSLIEFEKKELCDTCQKGRSIIGRIDGVHFETPDRITEDVFFTTAIGQSVVFLSENFREFILKEEFTNVTLLNSTKFRRDIYDPNYR